MHAYCAASNTILINLQRGIIEIDDDMYVMEPADQDDKNKDYSHVAHKMKHKPMKFENSNGNILCLTAQILQG